LQQLWVTGARGTISNGNDLEQHLRQNLKLRRELGAHIAKARAEMAKAASSTKQGRGGLLGSAAGAAKTTSENDDLGELRRELKLRRELGTEVAKAKDSSTKQGVGIAPRLGWVLYWIGFAIAIGWAAFILWFVLSVEGVVADLQQSPELLFVIALPMVIAYVLGRVCRYVFLGK
jgi:hypothetical protein